MKYLLVLTLTAVAIQKAVAFSPLAVQKVGSQRGSPLAATVDVEALLRKAAKLKAEAAEEEQLLHKNLLEKKECKEQELDDCIDTLFPASDESVDGLVSRLKESHWSTDRLMKITHRLHGREITAQGKSHVSSLHHDHTKFESVSEGNPADLARVQGLIDRLLEAAEIIDEEFMTVKRNKKDPTYLSHVDMDHWTMGELADTLRRQVGELRREHTEHFQTRLESFNEAQRKKDLPKPANKDEHKP